MNNIINLIKNALRYRSKTALAQQLGVSRATISLIASGKYPANLGKMASRLEPLLTQVECPHLGRIILRSDCAAYHAAPLPTGSRRALAHYRACRACPLAPNELPTEAVSPPIYRTRGRCAAL